MTQPFKYVWVDDEIALWLPEKFKNDRPTHMAVDTETTGLRWESDEMFLGIIAWGPNDIYLFERAYWDTMQYLLENRDGVPLVLQNAKFDLHFLLNEGIEPPQPIADTMVLAQATAEYSKPKPKGPGFKKPPGKKLEEIAGTLLPDFDTKQAKKKVDAWFNKQKRDWIKRLEADGMEKEEAKAYVNERFDKRYDQVPKDIMGPYAAMDGYLTWSIYPLLKAMVEEKNTQAVYDIDMAATWDAFDMERRGIAVDRERTREMISQYVEMEAFWLEQLQTLFGGNIAPHEDKWLANALESAGYEVGKYLNEQALLEMIGKTGEYDRQPTDVKQWIMQQHPHIHAILQWRRVDKTLHTYLQPIYKFSEATGRLHGSLSPAIAYTGRWGSSGPNMQNLPPVVRQLFIPDDGAELVSVDYSQMELRMMADYSRDPVMMSAYVCPPGEDEAAWVPTDLHLLTAKKIVSVISPGADPKEWRAKGKESNFALGYGAGVPRISLVCGCDRATGKQIKNAILGQYEVFNRWFRRVCKTYRQRGWIMNRFGRKYMLVDGLDYRGPNFLIQGSCADMLKLAIRRIARFIRDEGMRSYIVLTIHDEIMLMVYPEDKERLLPFVVEAMTMFPDLQFKVPFEVEISTTTERWSEQTFVWEGGVKQLDSLQLTG